MQTLTETIKDAGLSGRVLHESYFQSSITGSAQRRYNLVNRAMAAGELVRLMRGLYVLPPDIAGEIPHAFVVAQHVRPGSFVSFETALAWHSCIPESVRLTASVVPGRRKMDCHVPIYGDFRFVPLALELGFALLGVRRAELSGGVGLIADPLRALLDLICLRKISAQSLESFLAGLRLESERFADLNISDLESYRHVYQHQRMGEVIDQLGRLWVLDD